MTGLYVTDLMRRAGVLIAVAAVLTLLLVSCGGGIDEPRGLILGQADAAINFDVPAILKADEIPAELVQFVDGRWQPEDFQDRWRESWEEQDYTYGTTLDQVTDLLSVDVGQNGYAVVKGNFDLGAVRAELKAQDFVEGQSHTFEIWETDDSKAVAILENAGIFMPGDAGLVKDVLRGIDQDEGFLGDDADLKRVFDTAGSGFLVVAFTQCTGTALDSSGCRAMSLTITGGGPDTTEIHGSVLFNSESRAESSANDVELLVEDTWVGADIDELKTDGEFVTFQITAYQ